MALGEAFPALQDNAWSRESKVWCVDVNIASLGVLLIISLGGVLHEVWKAGGGGEDLW